ncbi:MAG: hypothetical protein RBU30_22760 [Polyangia bacterium]|jgi:hypothetical protein|nr:hypothetical protein [Polyangia bacterium]
MRRALFLCSLPALLASVLLVAAPTGCFKPKLPNVAFSCGDGGLCPDGYECRADGCCHRIGSPADEHGPCTPPADAAVIPDAAQNPDAAPDAATPHDAALPTDASGLGDASTTQDASP